MSMEDFDSIEPISPIEDSLPSQDFTQAEEEISPDKAKYKVFKKDIEGLYSQLDVQQPESFNRIVEQITQIAEKALAGIKDLEYQLKSLNFLVKRYKIAIKNLKENKSPNEKKMEEGIEVLKHALNDIKIDRDTLLAEIDDTFSSIFKEKPVEESEIDTVRVLKKQFHPMQSLILVEVSFLIFQMPSFSFGQTAYKRVSSAVQYVYEATAETLDMGMNQAVDLVADKYVKPLVSEMSPSTLLPEFSNPADKKSYGLKGFLNSFVSKGAIGRIANTINFEAKVVAPIRSKVEILTQEGNFQQLLGRGMSSITHCVRYADETNREGYPTDEEKTRRFVDKAFRRPSYLCQTIQRRKHGENKSKR